MIYQTIVKRIRTAELNRLVNQPVLWSGRFYSTLLFGSIILGINLLISFILPVKFTSVPTTQWFLAYNVTVAILFYIIWNYTQSLNDFRFHHGVTGRKDDLVVVCSFLVAISFVCMILLVPSWNLSKRIVETITDSQFPPVHGSQIFPKHFRSSHASNESTGEVSIWPNSVKELVQNKDTILFQTNLEYLRNLEIAKNGFLSHCDILNESQIRALPSDKRDEHSLFAIGTIEKYDESEHIYKKDTMAIYFNEFEDHTIQSEVFDQYVILRRTKTIAIPNMNTKASEGVSISTYYFSEAGYEEYYNENEIHSRLVTGKMINAFDNEIYSRVEIDKLIDKNIRNLQHATTINNALVDRKFYMFALTIILCYFILVTNTIIKFFSLRTYIISLCALLAAIVLSLFLIILWDSIFDNINQQMNYVLIFLIPLLLASALLQLNLTVMRFKILLATWIAYLLVPFAFVSILMVESSGVLGEQLSVLIKSTLILVIYLSTTPKILRKLYHLYSYPRV